jgi:hypothetical protein
MMAPLRLVMRVTGSGRHGVADWQYFPCLSRSIAGRTMPVAEYRHHCFDAATAWLRHHCRCHRRCRRRHHRRRVARWLSASRVGAPVQVDAWSVYQGTAWSVARSAVSELEQKHVREAYGDSLPRDRTTGPQLRCEFALHGVRRVMLPVFVFEYAFFGETFHVFVSGRRAGPEASGIDHGNLTASLSENAR